MEGQPSSSATHRHSHQSKSSPDSRSRSGSRHHDKRESVDILVQTWGAVVPGSSTEDCEENHHRDRFASQTSTHRRLGRCDGPGQLGSFSRLSRCDGPSKLGRGTRLSRLLVSRGSWVRSGRVRDCVWLGNRGQLSTASGSGRCRLSKSTESSRQWLGTSTWFIRGWLGTTTGLNKWWLDKDWQADSPGFSGRACTSE